MSASKDISSAPKTELIVINSLVTHFVEGNGTSESPYLPQSSTPLVESLADSYQAASNSPNPETKVYFTHDGHVVGIDKNMQCFFVVENEKVGDTAFQDFVLQTMRTLAEASNHTELTAEQREQWLKKMQAQGKL